MQSKEPAAPGQHPGAPLSQGQPPANTAEHVQYVGPYRLERTLGKGQTGGFARQLGGR